MKNIIYDIKVLPTQDEPLSSDSYIIDNDYVWDCGNSKDNLKTLLGKESFILFLSHFHPDHTENLKVLLEQDKINECYMSNHTYLYLNRKGVFNKDDERIIKISSKKEINDDMSIDIIPSCHARGCMVLYYKDILFSGDSLYGTDINGKRAMNVQNLYEQIAYLEKINNVKYIIESHSNGELREFKEVLNELKSYYKMKEKGNPFIYIK